MPSVIAFHRPENLDHAAELLRQPGRRALTGDVNLVPQLLEPSAEGVEVVDLQHLGLDAITPSDHNRLALGAMVTLGQMLESDLVPSPIRELAKREQPSTLRYQATVGGALASAAAHSSLLVAGLAVMEAMVEIHEAGSETLAQYLASRSQASRSDLDRLVTAITIEVTGELATVGTGRTPADVPIVAAVARRAQPEANTVTVALTGVGETVTTIDVSVSANLDEISDATAGLSPPSDFRGSSQYRRHLATTLTRRVLASLTDNAAHTPTTDQDGTR